MNLIPTFLSTLGALLLLEALWLGVIARRFYRQQLGAAMKARPDLRIAALFWLLYAAGVLYFAILPAAGMPWTAAALNGAVLGLVAYSAYDLTNWATLRIWNWKLAVSDIAWGTALTAAIAVAGHATV